jgi:hypothetical protein
LFSIRLDLFSISSAISKHGENPFLTRLGSGSRYLVSDRRMGRPRSRSHLVTVFEDKGIPPTSRQGYVINAPPHREIRDVGPAFVWRSILSALPNPIPPPSSYQVGPVEVTTAPSQNCSQARFTLYSTWRLSPTPGRDGNWEAWVRTSEPPFRTGLVMESLYYRFPK